ncbi:hypothetical protein L9F63_028219, partial [Diploptera punctata]
FRGYNYEYESFLGFSASWIQNVLRAQVTFPTSRSDFRRDFTSKCSLLTDSSEHRNVKIHKTRRQVDDELADIDLTDPELNKAATKIQASFRGHKVRKVGNAKDGEEGDEAAGQ